MSRFWLIVVCIVFVAGIALMMWFSRPKTPDVGSGSAKPGPTKPAK